MWQNSHVPNNVQGTHEDKGLHLHTWVEWDQHHDQYENQSSHHKNGIVIFGPLVSIQLNALDEVADFCLLFFFSKFLDILASQVKYDN